MVVGHIPIRFFPSNSEIQPNFLFQSIADVDLESLGSLEYLDLSRNLIQEIMPGTFMGMASLKGLDFSVNEMRKVMFIYQHQL